MGISPMYPVLADNETRIVNYSKLKPLKVAFSDDFAILIHYNKVMAEDFFTHPRLPERATAITDGHNPMPRMLPEVLQAQLRPDSGLKPIPLGNAALQGDFDHRPEPSLLTPQAQLASLRITRL